MRAIAGRDGRCVFAIVRRGDGRFGYFVDCLVYDEEDGCESWQIRGGDPESLFECVDEAEREIRARHAIP